MEVVTGASHALFPMTDGTREGEARRHAVQCAEALGFDDASAARVASVVTALADNLVQHAIRGRLLIASLAQHDEIEIISIDEGPGLSVDALAPSAGASSGGTSDSGLAIMRCLAQTLEVHSAVPQGTVVLARLRRAGAAPRKSVQVAVGGVSVPAPGEVVCGDAWIMACDGAHVRLLLTDGLGHGPGAAHASAQALRAFQEAPMAAPREQLQRAHAALQGTRGAALSVFALDALHGTVRLSGAGNVLGRVISGISDRSLAPQSGTAGLRIRTPDEVTTPWPPHGVLVAYSDGIESRWDAKPLHPLLTRDPSLLAAVLYRDHARGRDDATVVVIRRNH